jgi:hypothetical protein
MALFAPAGGQLSLTSGRLPHSTARYSRLRYSLVAAAHHVYKNHSLQINWKRHKNFYFHPEHVFSFLFLYKKKYLWEFNLYTKRKVDEMNLESMCNERKKEKKRKEVCLEGVTNATSSPQESSSSKGRARCTRGEKMELQLGETF